MPANDTQDDLLHHHHHDIIFNPIPNSTTTHYPPPSTPPTPNPKFLSLVLKAIVMVIIISLFFLFLGIAALAISHFFLAGGAFHRRRFRRLPNVSSGSGSDSDSAPYSAEDLQRHLPRLKYAAGTTGKDCAVCLEGFKEGEWCRSLPECHHMFHASCVDKWLTKVPNCPICRARIRLDLGATGSVINEDECKILWAVGF